MVRIFTTEEQYNITRAVEDAEKRTSAEIAILVAPMSDPYQSYRFFSGFIAGTFIALALWALPFLHIRLPQMLHGFLPLFSVQAATIAAFTLMPGFHKWGRFLVPKKTLAHCSYQRAAAEYFSLSHHVKAKTPIVFIYLSMAEHAVHIISGRMVREVLPNDIWQQAVNELTAAIKNEGLAAASIKSIGSIADLLAPHFPDNGEHNALPNEIRQLRR